jgi:glycine betaine/choline ABC-type transport system substrate-binding protein
MRKKILLITLTLALCGCYNLNNVTRQEPVIQDSKEIQENKLLTLPDAEKILGEPAHLTESSSIGTGEVSAYRYAYTANSIDQKSGKTGVIYFLLEKYNNISAAQKKYSDIKIANQNHEGVKVLHDLGDEAYFHSDGQNFYFIMVRKGEKVFNMKVNKTTGKTSLDAFNLVAGKITAAL